jgi:lysine 6-dehydrogenase
MQVLVLGAGLQGAACAFDLLRHSEARVTLADCRLTEVPGFLREFDGDRLRRVELDIKDEQRARAVMRGHDAAASALPYYFNFVAARLAVSEGLHFADLGGNTEIVRKQQTLEDQAVERGVTVVPDCGLAPGMVNVLARDAIDSLEVTDSVQLFVGGLPQHPEPPLNYQVVYSLEGAIDYYTTLSWVLRDGTPIEVEALSEVEHVEFPEPLGTLEAFHTAGGLSTMPWDFEGRVKTMEYKTLRYPGHVAFMKPIRELGLLSKDPIALNGKEVVPRDVFIAAANPVLRRPDRPDLVALRVVAKGTRDGAPATRSYTLVDLADEQRGISAMMRATGYSLSITCQMQLSGDIAPAGVRTAYQATPAAAYLRALGKRGFRIDITDQ